MNPVRDYSDHHEFAIMLMLDATPSGKALATLCQTLQAIRKRHDTKVFLTAPGLYALGDNTLQNLLGKGLLDGVYLSGGGGYCIMDAISAARRITAKQTVFVALSTLVNQWQSAMRAFIELQGQAQKSAYFADLPLLVCNPQGLDRLSPPVAPQTHTQWLEQTAVLLKVSDPEMAWVHTPLHSTAKASPADAAQQHSDTNNAKTSAQTTLQTEALEPIGQHHKELYLSATGLARMGGLDAFRKLPLVFDETQVGQFKHYLLLDNATLPKLTADSASITKDLKPGVQQIAGAFSLADGSYYVCDVVPAYSNQSQVASDASGLGNALQLPRQMFQVRRVSFINTFNNKAKMVFVASNFDKAKYIAAGVYAVLMQTHKQVELHLCDDLSQDNSVAIIENLFKLLPAAKPFIKFLQNPVGRGTYWIRNHALYLNLNKNAVVLVNDSDDVSSLQRAWLQESLLNQDQELSGCFLDIVRVDDRYRPLRLDKEIERYGTASLAIPADLVAEVGYFENIKRNADTEFIERVKMLKGPKSLRWVRYPCLFQVFDGNNLTADIYTTNQGTGAITANHDVRAKHTLLFRKQHKFVNSKNAARYYSFPHSSIKDEYKELGSHFIVDGYSGTDQVLVITAASDGMCKKLMTRGAVVFQLAGQREQPKTALTRWYREGGIHDSDLPIADALEQLIRKTGFSGYVLLADDSTVLDCLAGNDQLIKGIENGLLLLKTDPRQNNVDFRLDKKNWELLGSSNVAAESLERIRSEKGCAKLLALDFLLR